MPVCIYCQHELSHVATMYSDVDTRIELCPRCRRLADPYIGTRNVGLLADLVILKPGVLRHLLFNRLSRVALSERYKSVLGNKVQEKLNATPTLRFQLLRLGGILVLADAFVQWVHSLHSNAPHHAFAYFLSMALVDALAYHAGVIMAVRCLRIRPSIRTTQISLSILYSSFAKLFLLLLLVIADPGSSGTGSWQTAWRERPPHFLSNTTLHIHTKDTLWNVYTSLDDDRIDRPWIVNTIVGGMSAGFGLRVLLSTPPVTSTLIILAGWVMRSLALHLVS